MKKLASGYGNLARRVLKEAIADLCGGSVRKARDFFIKSAGDITYKKHLTVLCDLAGPELTDMVELARGLVLSGADTAACRKALMKKASSARIARMEAAHLRGKARRERVEKLNGMLRAVWKPEMTCTEAAERLGITVELAAAVGRRTGLNFRPMTKDERAARLKKAWEQRRARAAAGKRH